MHEFPTKDAACAVPNTPEYVKILEGCAKDSPVETYDNDCAVYAYAMGQSIGDLTQCLLEDITKGNDIFCNAQTSATATNTETASRTSSESGTSSSTDGSPSPSATGNAAFTFKEHQPSRFALSVIGFIVCALTAGATL